MFSREKRSVRITGNYDQGSFIRDSPMFMEALSLVLARKFALAY